MTEANEDAWIELFLLEVCPSICLGRETFLALIGRYSQEAVTDALLYAGI